MNIYCTTRRQKIEYLDNPALAVASAAGAQTCHLSYGNGPLIPNVKVVQIFWGTTNNPQYQYKDKLASYYDAITNSPYFDWLREYNTTNYMVGRGGLAAIYADSSPPAGSTIDEATVLQPYLSNLIDRGLVPAPDPNTIYMFHLPGTVQVHASWGTTCIDDCAYHFFYHKGGTEVRYAVIPDQNSGPAQPTRAAHSRSPRSIGSPSSHRTSSSRPSPIPSSDPAGTTTIRGAARSATSAAGRKAWRRATWCSSSGRIRTTRASITTRAWLSTTSRSR